MQECGMAQLEAVYSHLWTAHTDEFSELDTSLAPRSSTFLFEVAAAAGLGPQSIVVDVGCGRGNHCVELVKRFDCQAIGVDIILPPPRTAFLDQGGTAKIEFLQANIEQLPIKSATIDFVWCRDMLVHIRDLAAATGECYRILKGGGKMLAWVTVETELMEPSEAKRLYAPLGIEPASVAKNSLEAAFESTGFVISRAEMLGSELIEFYEEREGRASRELMRIARMRRKKEELLKNWGRHRYETAEALYHWVIYHLLGKLSSGYYLLEKPAAIQQPAV